MIKHILNQINHYINGFLIALRTEISSNSLVSEILKKRYIKSKINIMFNSSIQNNKRIAKNTLFMYFRMLITMGIGLYASRVVLATLGVSDYGLYNVVGGIVVILSSVTSALNSGTQRFLSFALGENDIDKLKRTFGSTQYLHIIFAGILFLLLETLGLWFLNAKMNIPEGRESAAFWVYQFSILTTVISLIQVPYLASIIAHEKMNVYAIMSIFDAIAKLLMVFLIRVISYDKLILYAGTYCLVSVSIALIYGLYCRYKFEECRTMPSKDKELFKGIAQFSGWNVVGCISVPLQTQGFNILLNIFYNTIVNAARGIAVQVNSAVMQFVNNFQTAVNPQIVKLYAAGEKEEMTRLVINNSKYAGFLYLLIAVPLFVEIEFVLDIWLAEYPDYTIPFVRIILIQSLIQTLTRPVVMVVHAVGRMKEVNLTAGLVLLCILPISYVLLKIGMDPITVMAVNVIPWLFETFFELYYEHKFIGFPIWDFYKSVYLVVFPIALILLIFPYFAHIYLPLVGCQRFLVVCAISVITSGIVIFYLGLSKHMREMIIDKAKSIISSRVQL